MQTIRLLLLPFSLLFGVITRIRCWLFKTGFKASKAIPGASICIGNITVGGTGKSPLTLYIADQLKNYKPIILSRGYGRKTKGLLIASDTSTAHDIGDEPFMYWKRFEKKIPVVVAEKRQEGVDWIRENHPESLILLDDAFQHRAVKSGLNIVVMTYDRPIYSDFPFPAGNLREHRSALLSADILFVSKCPDDLSENEKSTIAAKNKFPRNHTFFSCIVYGDKIGFFNEKWSAVEHIILVTGIAQPEPLKRYLAKEAKITSLEFPDHHNFDLQDIQKIQQKVATFAPHTCAVVTSEKDAMRLLEFKTELQESGAAWFIQQMALKIDNENEFKSILEKYVVRTDERSGRVH